MRHFLFALPFAVLGLAGCAGGNATSPRSASASYANPERSSAYMTPEQSSKLIILPGDSTTVVQVRYLSAHQGDVQN